MKALTPNKRKFNKEAYKPKIKSQKLLAGSSQKSNLQIQRQNLPIFSTRSKLLQKLHHNECSIVIGETGSGKTTQIPQYIYEESIHEDFIIACTQPRRVAAIVVAQRVAEEKNSTVGKLVGYTVRFEDVTSSETRIKYMTDGMLLREAILDPLLQRYSVVILDEAHERTIHTDVLFGVVKTAQTQRKIKKLMPLKIIVMSATMDVDQFSAYFSKAPVLYLEGRQFKVKLMYAVEPQSDYLFSTLVTVFQIHQEAPPQHDILVFLTGQEEIEATVKSIKDISKSLPTNLPTLHVCAMYSSLPSSQQLSVFQQTPAGSRKVIVATNVAETSVTIHGIKYVIDSGMVKTKSYSPDTGLDLLRVERICKAQAWQRSGRAGRESSGTCYRLYTESEFNALRTNSIPEIQRSNLAGVVLQLLALDIPNILDYDFMDKPSPELINKALDQLKFLGAIEKCNEYKLTPLGRKMSSFPLAPTLSRTILAAKAYDCLEEILTIVSILSVESVVHTPQAKKEKALEARQKFVSSEGDHITYLNIYHGYKGVNGNKQWCHENFINYKNMKMAVDIRRQLRDICTRLQLPLKSCGNETSRVRKCLTTGFFLSTAEFQREGDYKTMVTRKPVSIHPSSVLFRHKPACVIYNELVKTSKCYMRDLCIIDPDWLSEIAPSIFIQKKFR